MKKLSIVLLLCVFTMPAHAKFEPTIKSPVGSQKFCASLKEFAGSQLVELEDYEKRQAQNEKTYKDARYRGEDGQAARDDLRENIKKWYESLRELSTVSTIYSAWCK